jgi:hypothetical protein
MVPLTEASLVVFTFAKFSSSPVCGGGGFPVLDFTVLRVFGQSVALLQLLAFLQVHLLWVHGLCQVLGQVLHLLTTKRKMIMMMMMMMMLLLLLLLLLLMMMMMMMMLMMMMMMMMMMCAQSASGSWTGSASVDNRYIR